MTLQSGNKSHTKLFPLHSSCCLALSHATRRSDGHGKGYRRWKLGDGGNAAHYLVRKSEKSESIRYKWRSSGCGFRFWPLGPTPRLHGCTVPGHCRPPKWLKPPHPDPPRVLIFSCLWLVWVACFVWPMARTLCRWHTEGRGLPEDIEIFSGLSKFRRTIGKGRI